MRGTALLLVWLAATPALAVTQATVADAAGDADPGHAAFTHAHADVMPGGRRSATLFCQAARLRSAVAPAEPRSTDASERGAGHDAEVASLCAQIAPAPAVAAPEPASGQLGAPPPAPRQIVDLVETIARQYRVSPRLVLAIMATESNFDSAAVSPKNAKGLMQLIPDTALRFQVKNPFDPAQNVRGGTAYLRWLLAFFEGDVALVAAAYNAGERAVERHRGIPPYAETRAYVRRILAMVGPRAQPYDASVAKASAHLGAMRERQP